MSTSIPLREDLRSDRTASLSDEREASLTASGVSWGAIVAGAAGAASLSLILLILGTGLGLSSVSPWSGQGVDGSTFGVSTIVWLTFTQIAASGMGGYLAGRLRTKWAAVHSDEVYFRDTAHGFLAWGVATLATAALLGSVVGTILSGATKTVAAATTGGLAAAATAVTPSSDSFRTSNSLRSGPGYWVDSMFRKDSSATVVNSTGTDDNGRSAAESGRILVNALSAGALPAEDAKYLGQLVAQRTGLAQADAEKRVSDQFSKAQASAKEAEAMAKEAADKARKAASYAALWMFVSLLIGAFVASLAATFGGRQRDML